jgi:hypothetical protein
VRIQHLRTLAVTAVALALLCGCGVRDDAERLIEKLKPPSPDEVCNKAQNQTSPEQRRDALAMALTDTHKPVSDEDWLSVLHDAGWMANIPTYQPQIETLPAHGAALAIIKWCDSNIQPDMYVIGPTNQVTFIGLVVDDYFFQWSWSANTTSNGWAVINQSEDQHGDGASYSVMVIGPVGSEWGLVYGDPHGLMGDGWDYYFTAPVTFGFTEDYEMTIHVDDPAQPYEEVYELRDGEYFFIERHDENP